MHLQLILLLTAAVAGPLVAKETGRLNLGPDGAYRDLVIAIDRNSPEDPDIVEKVKAMMQEFSSQLSVATKPMFSNGGSLGLAHGYILVPKTWTNRTHVDANATWQTYDNADIRLRNSAESPHYTYHGGSCGTIGSYSVFDTNHLLRTDPYWLGKQALIEFGLYRWGLKNEHNGDSGPHFYNEGNKIVPVVCTRNITGSIRHNTTGEPCVIDKNTGVPEPHCRFYPDLEQTHARASILSVAISRDVNHFCEDHHSEQDEMRHNKFPPVPLTRCRGAKGARDVMRKSTSRDFRVQPALNPTPAPVQFTVVRPRMYRRLSVVIDVSSSMRGDPINKIKTGLEMFILEMLDKDGIELSIVTFNNVAKIVKPLDLITSEAKRKEYALSVRNLVASGSTAIGDGLALGMRTLGINPYVPSNTIPGYILLLTDGGENTKNNFSLIEAGDVLRKTSVIVDTVTFGPAADKRLTQLSKDTNGYSFFCRFENSTNDFLEELSKTVRDRVESTQKPIDIFSAPIPPEFSIPIRIDPSVGQDTSFLLSTYRASDITSMNMRVVSPSGKVINKASPEYVKDTTLGTVTIKISGQVESGIWTVTDDTSAKRQPYWSNAEVINTRAALTVTSRPASQAEPVILDGSVIGETEISINRSTEVVIAASLFKGAQMLRGAKILAKIESESNVDATLEMQDKGVYPDAEADDGIYSALVPLASIKKVQEYNVRLISDSPVARVTSAGKIYVKSVDTGSIQNLPPSSVQDLQAVVDLSTETVRLTWTAVGDEQNVGTASQYIIKSSMNGSILLEQFHSADNVSVSVTPMQSGSPQSVNISSSSMTNYNGSTFYLAVRAISSKGVAADVSNLVSTQLKLPDNVEIIEGGATTTIVPEVLTTSKPGSRAGPYCGVLAALLLAFGALTSTAAVN